MNTQYLDEVLKKYGNNVYSIRNAPDDSIYIGRGKHSQFGNPFPMNGEATRAQVCMDFRKWLFQKIQTDHEFANQVKQLHGHTLKYFCSNGTKSRELGAKWCHGHILLACADYLNQENERLQL